MEYYEILLVIIASFLAGGINAIAGGGTFFSFPVLLMVGVAPISANASNNVALWPATLASTFAYKEELIKVKCILLPFGALAFIGGINGSLFLLSLKDETFSMLIPWLLAFATIVFAFSKNISRILGNLIVYDDKKKKLIMYLILLPISFYGGFFGAGLGILLLAYLSIVEGGNLNDINALKNFLSAITYSISVIIFIISGMVSWEHTIIMLIFATLGGYFGAKLARKIPEYILFWFIVMVGMGLSIYYFIKTYC